MNMVLAYGAQILIWGTLAAAMWFVTNRLSSAFEIRRIRGFRLCFAAIIIVSAAFMFRGAQTENPIIGALYVTGGVVFFYFLHLTFLLIAIGILARILKLSKFQSAISALVISGLITLYGVLGARTFQVSETEIKIPNLKFSITLMHMPDIHIGHHRGRDYLQKIVDETNKRSPDFIVINGDLLDAKTAFDPGVLEPLSQFKSPVFYTGGNHEKYVDQDRTEFLVSSLGVRILRNELIEIGGIQVVGLKYMNADENALDLHASDVKETIKSVLPTIKLSADMPKIILHHSPVGVQYAAEKGFDLMLSGHTHAGQFFPGTLLTSLIFEYSRGLNSLKQMKIFVSQGAGTFMVPARIGTSNEINLIRLMPASQEGAE